METTRQNKIARLIQKDLGMIFQQQSRNLFGGAMITVTKVSVAKDLSIARIYISIYGPKDKEALLEEIRSHTRTIRRELGNREHNQLRIIPELHFFIDDSLDYIDNIDHLLHQ
jgi:ribosome-binding factor A